MQVIVRWAPSVLVDPMKNDVLMSASRAARLAAISRGATEQSRQAIRSSLRLLREPAYPIDRRVVSSATLVEASDCSDGGIERDRSAA